MIVSTDGGATWLTAPTNLSHSTVEPNGIDGYSNGWVDLSVDLSAYTGNVLLGFRYISDGGVNEAGFMVDDMRSTAMRSMGPRRKPVGHFTGFRTTTGTEAKLYSQYYVAEFRTYMGYDHGPEDGTLLLRLPAIAPILWITSPTRTACWSTTGIPRSADNNTGLHPGEGLLLPVDAHFQTLKRIDGAAWRNRVQAYDATFTLDPTDGIPNIHHRGVLSPVPSLPAVKNLRRSHPVL